MGGEVFLAWVRGADVLLANADEAAVLPAALAGHVKHTVIKRGADGALWVDPHIEVPAEPAKVVDVTGAGDAFAAGFLAAWCTGASAEEALRSGTALGARAVGTAGARPVPAAVSLVGVDHLGAVTG
jgi:sugar/nucleoside kinase (ribokinase family)